MQFTIAIIALAASISTVSAEACAGFQNSVGYSFQISPVNISTPSSKRDEILKRQTSAGAECTTNPIITLNGGNLTDQDKRQGEIVSNFQFQFDDTLQAGYRTIQFGTCGNGSLAVGNSTSSEEKFWSCNSGSFNNLYNANIARYCYPVIINVVQCAGGSSAIPVSSTPATSAVKTASSVAPATTAAPATSIPVTSAGPTTVTKPVVSVAPFPSGNATTPVGTASATTAHTTTSKPATFTPGSGASSLAVGAKLVVLAAGVVVFAMA